MKYCLQQLRLILPEWRKNLSQFRITSMNILVIEDDSTINKNIKEALQAEVYHAESVFDLLIEKYNRNYNYKTI